MLSASAVVVLSSSDFEPPHPFAVLMARIIARIINTTPETMAPIKITLSIFGFPESISSSSPKISSSSSS